MTLETRFIEPLDVLFLRGNKLFGDPGSYGEALIPPWPSVAAGAIRSRMLADERIDLAAFARSEIDHPTLGTPTTPGAFSIAAFQLARRLKGGRVEALFQMPADCVVSETAEGKITVTPLTPTPVPPAGEGLQIASPRPMGEGQGERVGITCSAPLPLLPVLVETERSKPVSGYWLTQAGWQKYLAGQTPLAADLVKSSALWKLDHRVGVGLDADKRRAADGRLFSVQAVAMTPGVGFVTAIAGATLPSIGTVRLGGDGRAAAVQKADWSLPEPDYQAIAQARRCRIVLATPGLFDKGWLPTGFSPLPPGEGAGVREVRLDLHGVKARLVCAAVPRAEVISGWDIARQQPKAAQRAAPTGSVYWLDELQATPEALRKLAAAGLWDENCEDTPSPQPSPQRGEGDWKARRAEGFNRFAFAAY